ncbi:MAG TPA: DUF3375 domain-containing protein [Roseiflexaceae bacterium]|nr:DUF3375 domain-containing protein [Roseiflexaceae bacterium]
MDHDQLLFDLKHTPSIKLLRSSNAPLILSFLHRVFKREQIIAIPHTELVQRLDAYLELLNEQQPGLYPLAAAVYIKQWSDEEHQLLRITTRGSDDPIAELTVEAERAIGWVEELYRREFVSTESRFRSILSLLDEIVAKSTEDVEARLRQLEADRDAIQREIDTIRATGQVIPSTTTEIKERFLLASEFGRQMTRDFAEVEQNFRTIARALQERQLQPGARKGELVGYMLDADAALREADQGRSFYAFWEFLMSPARQDNLAALLDQIYGLAPLQDTVKDHPLLRRITRVLIDAGEKIVQSNYRLAEQVRRLLDDRALAESRRARALIAEIKQHALHAVDRPSTDTAFIEIEGLPDVQLPMEKPLWEPQVATAVNTAPIAVGTVDLSDQSLIALYQQFYVDETELRRQIETLLETSPQCTLGEVLSRYPAQKGLAEIITYLTIATGDPRHRIDTAAREMISLPAVEELPPFLLALPRVIFRSAYAT